MEKFKKWGAPTLIGLLYAGGILLLSQLLLRSLDGLLSAIGNAADLDPDLLDQLCQAFAQLRDARIDSPWLLYLPVGALGGFLVGLLPKKLRWLGYGFALLLLLPALVCALCMAQVNTIRVIDLIRSLLPLLPALQ